VKTDMQIQQEVILAIEARLPGAARTVGVAVRNGVVTVYGQLGADLERYAVEQAAQGVEGVQALVVEIVIRRPGSVTRADADVADAVQAILQWQAGQLATDITIMVSHGWVTLSGEVERSYARHKITDALRLLSGVKGVHDRVEIRSSVSAAALRAGILAALRRRSELDAREVAVQVRGTQVTLSGRVHNWWERELARRSAWSAPGVRKVIDRLAIDS
jgi:osmotically-inducible protein OsmY